MKTAVLLFFVSGFGFFRGIDQVSPPEKTAVRSSMMVSTAWLAEHLSDPSLVLIHVGPGDEYQGGHIPGARLLSTADVSTPQGGALRLELPPADVLKAALEKIGISDSSRIVIYVGKDWVSPATRIFFTLDYFGIGDNTSILAGGFPTWRAEGRPETKDIPVVQPGSLTPHPDLSKVVDAAWIRSNLENPKVSIVDARIAEFYTGASAGNMPRAGHIPGAINIPFSSLVDEANRFRNPALLKNVFDEAGLRSGNRVVSYCHIGQQATVVYFVAKYLGFDAALYDGSFEDWSARADLPVVIGPAPRQK